MFEKKRTKQTKKFTKYFFCRPSRVKDFLEPPKKKKEKKLKNTKKKTLLKNL